VLLDLDAVVRIHVVQNDHVVTVTGKLARWPRRHPAPLEGCRWHRFIRNDDRRTGMDAIVRDEDVRSNAPRIDGTRITVLDVKRRVIDEEEDPHVVAGEYGISMAELFAALAYYYDHREEVSRREETFAAMRHKGERRTRELVEEQTESTERAD
jgi:uncharacterized protein (DUF433 family)